MPSEEGLDRQELHRILRQNDLVEILDTVRGDAGETVSNGISEFGSEVKSAADIELMTDLKEPLECEDELVGCLALLYEAENNTRVEQELNIGSREVTQ